MNLSIEHDFLLLCQGLIFFLIHILETFLFFLKHFPAFVLCGGEQRQEGEEKPLTSFGCRFPYGSALSLNGLWGSVTVRGGCCGSSIPNLWWDFPHPHSSEIGLHPFPASRLKSDPKCVHVLIPRPCEYVTLCGRKDFAGVIKLRALSWRDSPGLSEWPQSNHNHQGP